MGYYLQALTTKLRHIETQTPSCLNGGLRARKVDPRKPLRRLQGALRACGCGLRTGEAKAILYSSSDMIQPLHDLEFLT